MSAHNFLFLLSVLICSYFLTGAVRKYALWKSVIDIPNERSSHSTPTPRGGGVAIVLTMLIAFYTLYHQDIIANHIFYGLTGASLIVSTIGFIDDHRHIAARWRLLAHALAALWGAFWIGGIKTISIFAFKLDLGYVGIPLTCIYLIWLLNLYNFMDGIDGIASIEAITVCIPIASLTLFLFPDFNLPFVLFIFSSAVFGFLCWNFPPAKIFMGDACSGFIGLALGLFSVWSAQLDERIFWCWLIMLGVFFVDATVTLIRRISNKEKFYEAHRSHAYQHIARKIGRHKPVSLAVGLINLIWLFPISLGVILNLYTGFIGVIVAYIPLVITTLIFKAGKAA